MELQDQIYLVAGVLSAVILLLFVFVIILAAQLKKEKAERIKNEERFLTMSDPTIRRGEELERRGYIPYAGPQHHDGHHHPHHPSEHGSHHSASHSHTPHHPVHRQESKLSQLASGLKKSNKKKLERHDSEIIPSINTSIYHGYQGRVTDPVPSIYPHQQSFHHGAKKNTNNQHHY